MKNNTHECRTFRKTTARILCTLFLLSAFAIQATAQKALVLAALSKYGVDQSFLDPANLRLPVDHSFELKESATTAGKAKVTLAKFNPSAKDGEQWNVISVDGKSPSLFEANTFRNTRAKPPVDKPDEKTYRIDSQTAEQIIISYKLDATIIPMDARFLKDCRAVLTVDLKDKQLKQLQLVNEKPVKIGPLTAKKFEITTKFVYDKQARRYFPINDNLNMEAAFLAKTLTTVVETVYSNYAGKR
ncbi:hypothetical protein [Mucilaginibacter pedocola]|nr:hypothetical protein [Mucilaginibacter pedocola]